MQKFASFLLKSTLLLFCALSAQAGPGFITTWVTTDGSITIPTTGTGYNYTIVWDNLTSSLPIGNAGGGTLTGQTGSTTITGLTNGHIYEVEITGTFPRIYFNNGTQKTKLKSIKQWGNIAWTSMAYAFYGCSSMTCSATDAPNLSNVTAAGSMFLNCTNFNGDVSNWNVSNLTGLYQTFLGCTSFNSDLSGWQVGNMLTLQSAFGGCTSFNSDLSQWNVSNVDNIQGTFAGCTSFNSDLSQWNVSNVTSLHTTFNGCTNFTSDLSGWNMPNLTNLYQAFQNCSNFTSDLSDWDVSNVANMYSAFNNSNMSKANYDKTLISWAMQDVQSGISMGATGLQYCVGEAARATLISKGWTITGDSKSCNSVEACSTLVASISVTNSCATGSLQANATGGNAGYEYTWSTGASTSSLSGLPEGDYNVIVEDTHGCLDTAYVGLAITPDTIVLSNYYGTLSWVSTGGYVQVQYRGTPAGSWSTVHSIADASIGDSLSYSADCGYYQISESNPACGNTASNTISRLSSTLSNTSAFTTSTNIFNQDGFSYYRLKASTTPTIVPDSTPVNFKAYENGIVVADQTMTMARAKSAGSVGNFFTSCNTYSMVVSFTFDCVTYTRTSTAKSPILNINISRLGRKARHNADTLDLKWTLNINEITNAGTSISSYDVLVAKADNSGNASGSEVTLTSITDPTQISKREARITTAALRTAGILSASERISDISLRVRIKTVMASSACQAAFSNVHNEYRCAAFTFMTGCTSTSSLAARFSLLGSDTQGPADGITAYPNPSNGSFSLSIPEHLLEEEGLRLEIMNNAGQRVFDAPLQQLGEARQFDFGGKPSGIYLVRLVGDGWVHTTKVVLE